jgi:hypothetical protein
VALDLIAELEGLVDAFDREGIDYAICGGIALGILGHPRATADIDLLIQPDVTDRAAMVAKGCGFDIPGRKMAFGLRTKTPREVRRVSKLDPETGELMSLDLMVVAHEFVAVWASRITAEFRGRTLKVVSRDGLATMKRIAGRPQDLADLAKLEGTDDDEG